MSKTKYIKWLYEELPQLVSKGLLPEDTAKQLKNYYGEIDEKPPYDIALLLAAVLGAVLIGGGVILLFAHNWDQFSRPVRTFLSFAPLVIAQVIYGYVFFKKSKSTPWIEASSAFLMLMLAACIALISQTYHVQGQFEDFLLVWMLLSIPLLYLMNATLPAIFYLVGISSWVLNVGSTQSYWYWLLLLAAVPHLWRNMQGDKEIVRARLLGWAFALTFPWAFSQLLDYRLDMIKLVALGIFSALFYLLGERIYPEKTSLQKKPFQFVTVCISFVMLMVLGYDWPGVNDYPQEGVSEKRITFIIATILATAGYFYLAFQDWKTGRRLNYFMLLLPVVLLVGQLFNMMGSSTLAIILANVYLFGFGVYYIKYGIQKHRISLVNLGMFFISALIVARFFDTDWGFVVKGLIFIFLGIGFLWVNLFLSKKIKAEAQ
ncbi:MAG: putative membrane protein [Polaribacter sp.]|jgi:uncharacterized membrane protein